MKKMTKRHYSLIRQVAVNAAIIGLLCLWVMSINRTSDLFISGIDVTMDHEEGERDLISVKNVKTLIKEELPYEVFHQSISRLDIGTIERMLRADTRIFNAEVFVDAHYNLVVEIEQRRPILRVMNQQNDQFYIDQSGAYVRKVSNKATRVPVVTGYVETMKQGADLSKLPRLTKAYEIVTELRKDPVLKALIEQIHFEKSKRIVLIPKIGKEKIILDHVDQLEKKLEKLKVFYRHLAITDSWDKYDEIDISYHKLVYPRKLDNP